MEQEATEAETEGQRCRSVAKSRASSLSSEAKYKVLDACLRNHPLVMNIRDSYTSILQLKHEVNSMLKVEADDEEKAEHFGEYQRIVEQIPLEDLTEVFIYSLLI